MATQSAMPEHAGLRLFGPRNPRIPMTASSKGFRRARTSAQIVASPGRKQATLHLSRRRSIAVSESAKRLFARWRRPTPAYRVSSGLLARLGAPGERVRGDVGGPLPLLRVLLFRILPSARLLGGMRLTVR